MLKVFGLVMVSEAEEPQPMPKGGWVINFKVKSSQMYTNRPKRVEEYDAVMYFTGANARQMLDNWKPKLTSRAILIITGTLEHAKMDLQDNNVYRGNRMRVVLVPNEKFTEYKGHHAPGKGD